MGGNGEKWGEWQKNGSKWVKISRKMAKKNGQNGGKWRKNG
jgi:hypothetical protein